MKVLTVTLLLLCCHRCLGTLVVDLDELSNNDKKTFLALGQGIEINSSLTFCLRFMIKDVLATNYIFSSTDDELVLLLGFRVSLGVALINRVALNFKIPEDNGVLPFHWHHICVSSSQDSYTIVLDGTKWYRTNHAIEPIEKTNLKRLDLGSTNKYWTYTDGINFKGLLSELNIWSMTLSISQMEKITRNCGKVDPDLLNWSELPSSTIRGSKYEENIGNICPLRNATSLMYKIMPDLNDQDDAIHICKILNGELAFPNSLNELQSWNSKLTRMICILNVNNIITTYHIFCSICIRKYMSIFCGTNEKVFKWIID